MKEINFPMILDLRAWAAGVSILLRPGTKNSSGWDTLAEELLTEYNTKLKDKPLFIEIEE